MREQEQIFSSNVEIPEIVVQKAEAAFQKIKMEDEGIMNDSKNDNIIETKKRRMWKPQVAVAACVCLIAAGGITAVAAVHHFWSPGMKGAIQATDEQQQILTEQGVASVLAETENYEELAVTNGDITITPETVIVDDRFAYISFSVKGYSIEENAEPGFNTVDVYLGNDPNNEDNWLNMGASFYDGIVSNEMGENVYDDGSPLEYMEDEAGTLISHYVNEDGYMEYVVQMLVPDVEDSFLGETVHVELNDLGVVYKALCDVKVEGKWEFTLDLPKVSSATNIAVEKIVPDTVFVLDSMDISPVSIMLNYSVNGEVNELSKYDNGVPQFCGVVLKDGTKYPYIGDGGMKGFTDDTKKSAFEVRSFDRVIDVDQVASVLVRTTSGTDLVEIPVE